MCICYILYYYYFNNIYNDSIKHTYYLYINTKVLKEDYIFFLH